MSNWIPHPLQLENEAVLLEPLQTSHFDELINASHDARIWAYMPVDGTDKEKLRAALEEALLLRNKGEQYPFVIMEKASRKIIGSTRFLKLNEAHKNLEIGWTWYLPEYWGTGINATCKLLLLTYCFETLKTIRVQIVAREENLRSRKAIEKTGGKFEGIQRNIVIRNNQKRNAAFYSIIDDEWEEVKANLIRLSSN